MGIIMDINELIGEEKPHYTYAFQSTFTDSCPANFDEARR